MKVAGVMQKDQSKGPITVFSLDSNERDQYDLFRQDHLALEQLIPTLKMPERIPREKKIQQAFLNIVNPYLEETGVKGVVCFAGYDPEKRILVETPMYELPKRNAKVDLAFKATYWFKGTSADLSCTSNLSTIETGNQLERGIIDDMLRISTKGWEKKPIFKFQGNGIYFASTDLVMPTLEFMHNAVERMGDKILDLRVLRRECARNIHSESREQRVFREAYERELRQILLDVGLIDESFKEN